MALRLQRLTLGPEAPFIVYDGGEVSAAMRMAMHGTLRVPMRRRANAVAIDQTVRTSLRVRASCSARKASARPPP